MSDNLYIEHLHVQGYGCLKNVDAKLSRLHAFIGPNDSGKSTLLRAVRTGVQFAGGSFSYIDEQWRPFDPGPTSDPFTLALGLGRYSYDLKIVPGTTLLVDEIRYEGKRYSDTGRDYKRGNRLTGVLGTHSHEVKDLVAHVQRGSRLLHLDPDVMREPSELIPEVDKVRLQDESGRGLPAVYDNIINRGDDTFRQIVEDVRKLFPTVRKLRLKVVSPSTKSIEIELKTGERVPARFMSDGLLYYLAFAALRAMEPSAVLLVEEIENGLHPARIREVMAIMREISKTTQVLIATHSPLVINELQGDEVSVVTRHPEEGTRVTLLRDTPNFKERSKVYALGELWLSYANGVDEAALLSGEGKS